MNSNNINTYNFLKWLYYLNICRFVSLVKCPFSQNMYLTSILNSHTLTVPPYVQNLYYYIYLYVVVNAGLHIDSWIFYQACACIPDLTIYVYLELYRQTQTFLWCRKFTCFFLPTKIHSRFLHTKVSFFWVSSQDRGSSGFRPLIGWLICWTNWRSLFL